jgi:hypothetical protein
LFARQGFDGQGNHHGIVTGQNEINDDNREERDDKVPGKADVPQYA